MDDRTAVTDAGVEPASDLKRLPTFDLDYAVDDEDDPRWVAVYSEAVDELVTHWIMVDVEHAVSLDDVA